MDDASFVQGAQGLRDLDGEANGVLDRDRASFQALGQRLAVQVLHDEERHAVLLPDIVKRADVRMADAPDGSGLAPESFELRRAGVAWGEENLDGDSTIEAGVASVINLAHATRAEQFEDFVRTELCASG
jgi:hypothetical protein